MLVLTRKPGETIVIGDDIRVTIVKVNGRQIHIGIEAPKEVSVDREEVRERKESEDETVKRPDPHNR